MPTLSKSSTLNYGASHAGKSNVFCGSTDLDVLTLHDSGVRFRLHQPTRYLRHDHKMGCGCLIAAGMRDRDRVVVVCLAERNREKYLPLLVLENPMARGGEPVIDLHGRKEDCI
jgi:hypothetical protein